MNLDPLLRLYEWSMSTTIIGIPIGVIVAIAVIGFTVYKKWTDYEKSKKGSKYLLPVKCTNCGWLGEVSQFHEGVRRMSVDGPEVHPPRRLQADAEGEAPLIADQA